MPETGGTHFAALLLTAAQHGHTKGSSELGRLTKAAAEATWSKHHRVTDPRLTGELSQLRATLAQALTGEGLTLATCCFVPLGIAVDPLPGGPSWGVTGDAGLTFVLYGDSGWYLMANTERSTAHSVYASADADGARKVAAIVHGILQGDIPNPFRAGRR
ncbi:hypothetical protein ACH40F_53925 [Streptomyces sp. NPDC020794]|uniref:hypothetical protein n=1 Tax=unclassified Streptomyces TaxID=2593676 RepID=UPI0036E46855